VSLQSSDAIKLKFTTCAKQAGIKVASHSQKLTRNLMVLANLEPTSEIVSDFLPPALLGPSFPQSWGHFSRVTGGSGLADACRDLGVFGVEI
jgi:hypothetical protein